LKVVWSDPEAQRAWMAKEAARMASLPVLFLLDEFGTIGRLGAISTGFGLAAGTGPGISIWAFVQDLNQLKRYYPNEFETFLGNVGSFISFGIMDAFTLGYISHQLGMRTIRYKTTGKTIQRSMRIRPETMEDVIGKIFGDEPTLEEASGSSESSNTTEHVVAQPLASPDDIRKMHPQNCIVIGHDDPILCRRVDYYSDPTFSAWVRPDPKYAKA
jgi:type IV secretory pathway TraG/TraD family ATPase VirD4